ncbi:MAG: hypothetical protein GXX96_29090 [Planctomycetaceae bacterium]|nr:hypothetical protein [Planctomycetaceae bacterium]
MDLSQLLPRVVHRDYFNASGIADVDIESDRFGFVSHLGHDVYMFLACTEDGFIRNIQQEDLDDLGLTIDQANAIAIRNLSQIAFDGQTIQQQLTTTETGNDWAVWLGSEFTSSCILLPELYAWSQRHLRSDAFLVRVPSTQLLFVLQFKNRSAIGDFNDYITKVADGADNLVSSYWFVLEQSGLFPFDDISNS